jgi:hypothetical protein
MNASMANAAMDDMDAITGIRSCFGRIDLPPIPTAPVMLTNIKVDNSVVGAINTGNVQAIDVSLTVLQQSGNDKASDALKQLTEAILQDKTLDQATKHEMVEQVAYLSEQAIAAAKDRKPSVIKATLGALAQAAGTVTAIATAWNAAEPILKSVFGL